MASRPTVTIATAEGKPSGATAPLPAVFTAPIRLDVVQYVRSFYTEIEEISERGLEDG
jgi:large subunit ribosomal protein L4e